MKLPGQHHKAVLILSLFYFLCTKESSFPSESVITRDAKCDYQYLSNSNKNNVKEVGLVI